VPALDHVDVVVGSLERSLPFYRDLLAPLGWKYVREVTGERGEDIHYLFGAGGKSSVGLRERQSGGDGAYDRYSTGLHHIAFAARSRRVVDGRAEWLRSVDAEIESGPAVYGYTPGYYAVFFHDPDGVKLEVVHRPFLRTAWWGLNPRTSPMRKR
jgi:catechol 2,3-dioxygenase-like lactoylglutathione lyase family enzyme